MSWDANASALVVQLRTQLQACAAWTTAGGALDQIHFPDGEYAVGELPAAIIRHIPGQGQRVFLGVETLPSGEFEIEIIDDTSIGAIESLAQSISTEICTDLGIAGLEGQGMEPAEVGSRSEQVANDSAIFSVLMTLSYGLEP